MENRPNILLMVADTQRVQNLGCYGYDRPTSPNWDAVAEEGVVCEQNIAPGIWSLPCYASMMTGAHIHTHRADADHEYVRHYMPTLAELLTEAGYQTCGIMRNTWGAGVVGLDRGFDVYVDAGFGEPPPVRGWQMPEFADAGGSELNIRRCESWLDDRDTSRPFFLFTVFPEPHATYNPPQDLQDKFMIPDVSDEEIEDIKQRQNVLRVNAELEVFDEREWEILHALNDAEVARCDQHFGRVLNALKERGLYDNTLIILASDHGDVMGDRPPWWGHLGAICDSLIHVPLVLRHPETFDGGTRIEGITQTQDIFATCCDVAGAGIPEIVRHQSHSILDAVEGKNIRKHALSEVYTPVQFFERILRVNPEFDVRRYNRSLKAWRSTDYKYVWSSDGNDELYDLNEDPMEHNNIVEEMPDRLRDMKQRMEDYLVELPYYEFGDLQSVWPGKAPKPEIEKRLKAWGLYRQVLDPPDWAPR